MIQATEADIGRRVIYVTPDEKSRGVIVGVIERAVLVQFNGHPSSAPLRVFSNLQWDDKK